MTALTKADDSSGSPSVSSFQVEKFAPRDLRADGRFEYILRVTNTGRATLTGAVLVEAMISSITILSSSPNSEVLEPNMGRWAMGDIPPGKSREVLIQAVSNRDMPFRSYSSLSFSTRT